MLCFFHLTYVPEVTAGWLIEIILILFHSFIVLHGVVAMVPANSPACTTFRWFAIFGRDSEEPCAYLLLIGGDISSVLIPRSEVTE